MCRGRKPCEGEDHSELVKCEPRAIDKGGSQNRHARDNFLVAETEQESRNDFHTSLSSQCWLKVRRISACATVKKPFDG